MSELVFEVTQETDGGYVAEALGGRIFTQAHTWDELRANVREAVAAHFFDRPVPPRVRLHLVRDEVLLLEKPHNLARAFELLCVLPGNADARADDPPQRRD